MNYARSTWTYIINIQPTKYSSNTYIGSFTYGAGISATKAIAISKAIRQIESEYSECTCLGIDKFSQLLSDLDDNNWNVICKQGTDKYITGRMRNVELQYF